MLELISQFYSKVPEWGKQIPAAGLLVIAVTTYMSGRWMSTNACNALRDADQKETIELRDERNRYRDIAFNSVGFLTERAQQSAKVNEEVTTPRAKASPSPVVATVRLPVTPLTQREKDAIQKPKDAEPATLSRSLEASKKVLEKTNLTNAQPVKKSP
jgi:hypothetical protein